MAVAAKSSGANQLALRERGDGRQLSVAMKGAYSIGMAANGPLRSASFLYRQSRPPITGAVIKLLAWPQRPDCAALGLKGKPPHRLRRGGLLVVAPLGFEPRTRTLKVYCSTS